MAFKGRAKSQFLEELHSDLGIADEAPDDVMRSLCDPELPDAGEIWGGTYEPSPKKPAIQPVKN
jgi:hypothetical protein